MPSKAKKPEKKAKQVPEARKERKRSSPWKIIIPTVLAVIIIIVLVLALRHNPGQPPALQANQTAKTVYEITEQDIFSKELRGNITGDAVSVLGMKLGDKLTKIFFVLGEPDDKTAFADEGINNLEYGKSLGLNKTGVLFHFENDTLKRISIYPPFNSYLKGETKINHTERIIFDMFGIRDREYKIMTIPFTTRVFVYEKRGLEIFIDKDETGFSLIYPE